MPFAKSRSIDGSNRCILEGARTCVVRIPRKSQGPMALGEIGPKWPRPLSTDFRRRGPWGAHFARPGNIPNTPAQGSAEGLTRRWAEGRANLHSRRAFYNSKWASGSRVRCANHAPGCANHAPGCANHAPGCANHYVFSNVVRYICSLTCYHKL